MPISRVITMGIQAVKTPSVSGLERGLVLLELLTRSKVGLTMTQLVEVSEFPRSSVHTLLLTLQRRGYLYRNHKTRRYMFARKLLDLANTTVAGLLLREVSSLRLQALTNRLRMTTHMGILENYQALIISKFAPAGHSRESTWVGGRLLLHSTGLGKALISQLSTADLRAVIRVHGLPKCNENTICSDRKFELDIACCRERGFSISDEECELGSRCLGAPILDEYGNAIAAISVAGTTDQIRQDTIGDISQELKLAAIAISQSVSSVSQLLSSATH